MENLEIQKKIQNTYYIHPEDIPRLKELIKLMPNYDTKSESDFVIVDYFYETPEKLLEQLNSSIRVRVAEEKQTLSIVCTNNEVRHEYEMEMKVGEKIQDKNEYILFLEDKLQDIYTHRIDIDIARILKDLKVFLYITTNRHQIQIINNTGYSGLVNIDTVLFSTKRHNVFDYVLEIKMDCVQDTANMTAYNRFVRTLEQKLLITPMDETKFDAGKRVFRSEY